MDYVSDLRQQQLTSAYTIAQKSMKATQEQMKM